MAGVTATPEKFSTPEQNRQVAFITADYTYSGTLLTRELPESRRSEVLMPMELWICKTSMASQVE